MIDRRALHIDRTCNRPRHRGARQRARKWSRCTSCASSASAICRSTIMLHEKLVEKHAAKAGLPTLKTKWSVLGNAVPINDRLIAGTIHVGSGGIAPMVTAWDRTRGNVGIYGIGALCALRDLPRQPASLQERQGVHRPGPYLHGRRRSVDPDSVLADGAR